MTASLGAGARVVRWVSQRVGAFRGRTVPDGLRVLLYHSVGSEIPWATYGLSISRERFARHMRWLKEESGCRLVGLEEGVRRLAGEADGQMIAVTFDDGFRDNLRVASPILHSLGIPFTVFVTASYLRRTEQGDPLFLAKEELRDLAGQTGVSVGAHGLSHRPLTRLAEGAVLRELAESRLRIEELTGKAVVMLSYPHGAVNTTVRRAAQACGYRLAATSFHGLNHSTTDPLMLHRTEIVGEDDVEDLRVKIRGGYDWYGLKQRLYWPVPRLEDEHPVRDGLGDAAT